jgi:Fur family ferric uptake transcriptional regulator
MAQRTGSPSPDDLRGLIRDAGLRVTAPRVAVLRSLFSVSTPQSHADVMERLSGDGWDRATIYRNLIDLTEAGIVRRADLGDHVWRFEAQRAPKEEHAAAAHPHFMCNECGNVVCLPGESVQVKPVRGAPRALRGKRFEVQIRGRCDRCA